MRCYFLFLNNTIIPDFWFGELMAYVQEFSLKAIGVISLYMIVQLSDRSFKVRFFD